MSPFTFDSKISGGPSRATVDLEAPQAAVSDGATTEPVASTPAILTAGRLNPELRRASRRRLGRRASRRPGPADARHNENPVEKKRRRALLEDWRVAHCTSV